MDFNQSLRVFLSLTVLASVGITPSYAAVPGTVTFRNFFSPSDGGSTSGLTFDRPIAFAQYPDQDSVYAVVEEVGRITTVEWKNGAWAKSDSARIPLAVLNNTSTSTNKCTTPGTYASSPTITTGVYESRGLLGFAFHPDFKQNRKYYISYVTVVSSQEFSVVAERVADSVVKRPRTSDPQRNLLSVCQPYWDHKGGTIAFGPEGHLYFALGDGGNQSLNPNPGPQRLDTYLGKMIRIDVTSPPDSAKPYKVPADNPFVGNSGALPEIWAYGLRNPWKWGFHPVTGKLWLGDVGYVSREEISIVPKGGNMGWRLWEGDYCQYTNSSVDSLRSKCITPQAVPPVFSRVHQDAGGYARSLTGGTFRSGDTSIAFSNTYIFGDYIFGDVWALSLGGPLGETVVDSTKIGNVTHVVSFDRDSLGHIFATSLGTGSITPNTGVVYVLDFAKPVGIRADEVRAVRSERLRGTAVSWNDLLRNPEKYEIRGLDGREVRGGIQGDLPAVFRVREKGAKGAGAPGRLMTAVH